jgi:hypothetical protein
MKTPPHKQIGTDTPIHVRCGTCQKWYEVRVRETRGDGAHDENTERAVAVLRSAGAKVGSQHRVTCPVCSGRPPSRRMTRVRKAGA